MYDTEKTTLEAAFEGMDETALSRLAARLAELVFAGGFIALFGELGAGKTTFVRHFAARLGIESVLSPTFTIVRQYASERLALDHFDCYRLASEDELDAMGFSDYLASDSVILMEWSERVRGSLPAERLEVHIEGSGSEKRRLLLRAIGENYCEILRKTERYR